MAMLLNDEKFLILTIYADRVFFSKQKQELDRQITDVTDPANGQGGT